MSIALASRPWPVPGGPTEAAARCFARRVSLAGRDGPRQALQWVLKRNCSITPRQLMAVYASLCAVSLAVAAGFWLHGAPYVLAFAVVELALFGAALIVHARHVADRETVTLDAHEVQVEQRFGGRVAHAAFRAKWLRVEPARAQGSLVELAGQGRRVCVGRYLRPELRPVFAQEFRRALRRAQAGLPPQDSELEPQR